MADDLYDDAGGTPGPPAGAEAAPAKESEKESDVTEAVLPTAFFGGREVKPGQRETIEITSVHDGQVSAKCIYGEEKEEKAEAPAKAAMPESEMGGGEYE